MMRRPAFTLLELLVTVSIIVVLAALLLPIGSIALERSRGAGCQSNLRNLGMALTAYSSDNNGQLLMNEVPAASGGYTVWCVTLAPYGGYTAADVFDPVAIRHTILACPSETSFQQQPYYCYSMNMDLDYRLQGSSAQVRMSGLGNAAAYVVLCDSFLSDIFYTSTQQRMTNWTQITLRHTGTPNFLYADGHVAPFAGPYTGYLEVGSSNQASYYNMYFANGIPPWVR